ERRRARRGIQCAIEGRAKAILLLSSDLPLVTRRSVHDLLAAAATVEPPAIVAVPALGRGGTNGLYMHPPGAIGLHFGMDSLVAFRAEAERNGIALIEYQ